MEIVGRPDSEAFVDTHNFQILPLPFEAHREFAGIVVPFGYVGT